MGQPKCSAPEGKCQSYHLSFGPSSRFSLGNETVRINFLDSHTGHVASLAILFQWFFSFSFVLILAESLKIIVNNKKS